MTLVLDGKILLAVVGIGLVAMRIQKGAKGQVLSMVDFF
jgi:hypothetical protein